MKQATCDNRPSYFLTRTSTHGKMAICGFFVDFSGQYLQVFLSFLKDCTGFSPDLAVFLGMALFSGTYDTGCKR
jgi:hypothetical protein